MPTNHLERLERQSVELEQEQARHLEKRARHKVKTEKILLGMIRAAGQLNLSPQELRRELEFSKALRGITEANKLDVDELHRELLAVARRKLRREPLPVALAAE